MEMGRLRRLEAPVGEGVMCSGGRHAEAAENACTSEPLLSLPTLPSESDGSVVTMTSVTSEAPHVGVPERVAAAAW